MAALTISTETLAAMEAHARAAYPDECCGVIAERSGREEVVQVTNIQNQLHAKDPAQFPRDARTAYCMDGRELLHILTELDRGELQLRAFYHSHPDHDAYFSAEDKTQALGGADKPSYPAPHVVLSVHADAVRAAKAFEWNDAIRDFVETSLVVAS